MNLCNDIMKRLMYEFEYKNRFYKTLKYNSSIILTCSIILMARQTDTDTETQIKRLAQIKRLTQIRS